MAEAPDPDGLAVPLLEARGRLGGRAFEDKPWAAHDARVSVEHLKDVIWHIYTHRGEAREKGELASRVIPQMCDWPVVVENLFRRENIPHVNSTHFSVEEISAKILVEKGVERRFK